MSMREITVSQQELADWLSLSSRRIRELTKAGILKKAPRYRLRESVSAYLEFIRAEPGNLTEERARLVKAQADLMELKLRSRRGEVVELAEVQQANFAVGRQIRDAVENLPPRLSGIFAAESDQEKIFELFSREIQQCLESLKPVGGPDNEAAGKKKNR
jgi:phage terminase Nu1 subunit (DNA packaging protein)